MAKFFRDHDGSITLHKEGREVTLPRGEFIQKFPDYSMPGDVATRRWDGTICHGFKFDGSQFIDNSIAASKLESYIDAVRAIKEEQEQREKQQASEAMPSAPTHDWGKLESLLVGSPPWTTMINAMTATNKCNAAGTLILSAFSLKNQLILQTGFTAMVEAMESKTVTGFSKDDLQVISGALVECGFNPLDVSPDPD